MQCDKMLICLNVVSMFVIIVSQSGLSQNVELPPSEFPKDNITYRIYNINSPERSETPPHVFPDNDLNYKIIKNITILKDLMSHTATKDQNQTKVDTEVPDLIVSVLAHENTAEQNLNQPSSTQTSTASFTSTPTGAQKILEIKSTTQRDLEMDQEEIESDLSKTEDVKKNASASKVPRFSIHQDHGHAVRGSGPILQGHLAAVLAGVFAMVAVASYVGLLTCRRYLEHRYGNRELLINEEDQFNYNDMKNFEL